MSPTSRHAGRSPQAALLRGTLSREHRGVERSPATGWTQIVEWYDERVRPTTTPPSGSTAQWPRTRANATTIGRRRHDASPAPPTPVSAIAPGGWASELTRPTIGTNDDVDFNVTQITGAASRSNGETAVRSVVMGRAATIDTATGATLVR